MSLQTLLNTTALTSLAFMPRVAYAPADGRGSEPSSEDVSSILDTLDAEEASGEEGEEITSDEGEGAEEKQPTRRERKKQDAESEDEGDTEASDEDADTATETEADQTDDKSQSEPPIEAPASWKAEAKKDFDALPRKVQQVIADRERDREATITRTQQEAAASRNAVEAERGERQKERQSFAQNIGVVIDNSIRLNPILAEAAKLANGSQNLLEGPGWIKLLNENPDAYHKMQANTRYVMGELQALQSARQQAEARVAQDQSEASNANMRAAYDKLTQEFKLDTAEKWTKFDTETSGFLTSQGFPPEVVKSLLKGPYGAAAVKIVRKAMNEEELLRQQASIPAARKVPAPKTKTAPAKATVDSRDKPTDRTKVFLARAKTATNDRDAADWIAKAL